MSNTPLSDWVSLWTGFQFLRPWWLCLIPVIALWIGLIASRSSFAGWSGIIDKSKLRLLKFSSGSRKIYFYLAAAMIVTTVSLAGPSFTSIPGKSGHLSQARVFVLDLSPSMLASDITPDRLSIAKLKLIDMLRLQADNQTGLVVYAADAHKVTPLIDDPRIAESLVPVLHPDIMPQSGSNAEAGIALATRIIAEGGYSRGDIVLITDGLHKDAISAIKDNWQASMRLSILAVGTEAGAPIPNIDANGKGNVSYVRDADDNIVVAQLNIEAIKELVKVTGGRFSNITSDSKDVKYLTSLSLFRNQTDIHESNENYDQYHDAGYWLVLALLPIILLSFRKNVLWIMLPLLVVAPDSHAFEWADLWLTKDKQAQRAFLNGDFKTASNLFTDTRWQAASLYRQQQFTSVIELLSAPEYANDIFNRANAQALSGDLDSALSGYRIALGLYRTDQEKQNTLKNIRLIRHLIDRDQDENSSANQNGASKNTLQSESESQEMTESTTGGEQAPIGGVAGGNDTLQQQAIAEQSSGKTADRIADAEIKSDLPNDANDSNYSLKKPQNDQPPGSETDKPNEAIREKNNNPVLSPYAEQWLRELPDDPGGYLRRKFGFQMQVNSQTKAVTDAVVRY